MVYEPICDSNCDEPMTYLGRMVNEPVCEPIDELSGPSSISVAPKTLLGVLKPGSRVPLQYSEKLNLALEDYNKC